MAMCACICVCKLQGQTLTIVLILSVLQKMIISQRWTTPLKMGMLFKFSPRMGPNFGSIKLGINMFFPEHFCLRLTNLGAHAW